MEVVAVAERERQWRWEIRHGGQLVRESRAEFPTLQDAIKDGKQQLHWLWIGDDRPQITRKSQCWRRAAGLHGSGNNSDGTDAAASVVDRVHWTMSGMSRGARFRE